MKGAMPARVRADHTSVSVPLGLPSSKFSRTVPSNSSTSCCTTPMLCRMDLRLHRDRGWPSMRIWPDAGSYKPMSREDSVVLPQPLLPTIATWLPGGISSMSLCRMGDPG
ncbi:hypothetical protein D3C75_1046350 [compost metagenome]